MRNPIALLDRFIPEQLMSDALDRTRARFLVFILLLNVVLGIGFFYSYLQVYRNEAPMLIAVWVGFVGIPVGTVLCLYVLYKHAALRMVGLFFVFTFLVSGLVLVALDATPLTTTVFWMVLVPVVAVLICGIRIGVIAIVTLIGSLLLIARRFESVQLPVGRDLTSHGWTAFTETLIMIVVMFLISVVWARLIELRTQELEQAKAEVETLRGLLPICAWCKKIQDEEGDWVSIERYIGTVTQTQVTHGICPNCAEYVDPDG